MQAAFPPRENLESGAIQTRLISPCVSFGPEGEVVPDIPVILKRLLLFETFILQTIRLREFVPLVRSLGINNVITLLDSGALKLQLDPTQIFQSGQTETFPAIRDKPPLPLRSFAFSLMKAAEPNDYLVKNLQDLRRNLYGPFSQADLSRIEQAIMRAFLLPREESGFDAIKGLESDLRSNSPALLRALVLKLREVGREVPEGNLRFNVAPLDETDYQTDTNLADFGLSIAEEHKTVEAAMLAVGALNLRIEEMNSYDAISGLIGKELPIFDSKVAFLRASVLGSTITRTYRPSNEHERHFDRVVKIRRLPDIGQLEKNIDMERFLDIRNSKECREFRSWLRTTQADTDEQIAERIDSLRARLAPFIQSGTGKTIRVALSTLAGLIPGISTLSGIAFGVLDTFLIEKLFPASGPILFLSRQYPSLFKAPTDRLT